MNKKQGTKRKKVKKKRFEAAHRPVVMHWDVHGGNAELLVRAPDVPAHLQSEVKGLCVGSVFVIGEVRSTTKK